MTDSDSSMHARESLESLAEHFDSTSLADMESSDVPVEPARLPMVSRSIRMEQSLMSEIRKVAERQGVPVTQLMRQWIRQGLAQARACEKRTPSQPVEASTTHPQDPPNIRVSARQAAAARQKVLRTAESRHAASQQTVLDMRIEQQVRRARNARNKETGMTKGGE